MHHTLPEIIGMALGIAFLAAAFFTAGWALRHCLIGIGRDIRDGLRRLRAWWQNRRPAPGWQPRRALFWRPESGIIGGIIMGLVAYAVLVAVVWILRGLP